MMAREELGGETVMAWGKRRDDVSKRLPKRGGKNSMRNRLKGGGEGEGKTSQSKEWVEFGGQC